MPTNLYDLGDNFDLQSSHVIPAMIRRFHEAKISGTPCVNLWGNKQAAAGILHVDDLANAACLIASTFEGTSRCLQSLLPPSAKDLKNG